MDPKESKWILMDSYGSQWMQMDPNGSQWIPMDFIGIPINPNQSKIIKMSPSGFK